MSRAVLCAALLILCMVAPARSQVEPSWFPQLLRGAAGTWTPDGGMLMALSPRWLFTTLEVDGSGLRDGVVPQVGSWAVDPGTNTRALVGTHANSVEGPPSMSIMSLDGTAEVERQFEFFNNIDFESVAPLIWFPGDHGAVLAYHPVSAQFNPDLYRVDLQTGDETLLIPNLSGGPFNGQWFSPDGSLFIINPPGSDSNYLLFSGITGQFLAQLTFDDIGRRMPSWSPDGTRIAWGGGALPSGEQAAVSVYDLGTMEETGLFPLFLDPGPWNPPAWVDWAPDGETLVYQYGTSIYVTNATADFNHVLYTHPSIDSTLYCAWSPAGDAILVGVQLGPTYTVLTGVLPAPPLPVPPPWIRGDVDADGAVTPADLTLLLGHLAGQGAVADPLDRADVDDDGDIAFEDAFMLMAYLDQNGPPPAPPFEVPGWDSTPDDL